MNDFMIAAIMSGCILAVGIFAYFASWIWQSVWAWIDDGPKPKENFVAKKLSRKNKKWKYPVYNESEPDPEKDRIFGYAKDKKYNEKSCWDLEEGVDYIYTWRFQWGGFWSLLPLVSLTPIIVLLGLKVYPLTLFISVCIALAFTARFARRTWKGLAKHISDKSIHVVEK